MPVKTGSGRYITFRYEPSYLQDPPALRTDFLEDISCEQKIANIVCSDINPDGGNAVFSPSKQKAIISNRDLPKNSCTCLYLRNRKTRWRSQLYKPGKLISLCVCVCNAPKIAPLMLYSIGVKCQRRPRYECKEHKRNIDFISKGDKS